MMQQRGFGSIQRLFSLFLSVACLVVVSHGALADSVAGCNPDVQAAMQAKAQARQAYDIAVSEQVIKKPDSVLAISCFNQAAGISAYKGGKIFSDADIDPDTDGQSLLAAVKDVVEKALVGSYPQFAGAIGYKTDGTDGTVKYNSTLSHDPPDCPSVKALWDEADSEATGTIPYATDDNLASGSYPTDAGDDFKSSWDDSASQGVFTDLSTAQSQPSLQPTPPTDFSTADSSCAVLVAAGVIGSCP